MTFRTAPYYLVAGIVVGILLWVFGGLEIR